MKTLKAPAVYTVSLDEIIFANKNKAYGAYLLRTHYSRHISIALLLSVSIFTIFSIFSIVINRPREIKATHVPINVGINLDRPPETKDNTETVKPTEPLPVSVKPTIKFLAPKITVDAPESEYMPTAEELERALPSLTTQAGNPDGIDENIFDKRQPVIPDKIKIVPPDIETPLSFAQVMPAYPGGESELLSFLGQHIRYPEMARKVGVEGKVLIQFIVEKDGSLSNFEILKSIGAGCDDEALRVCKLMEMWHPGLQNGKAVRVKMVIPIVFRLNE